MRSIAIGIRPCERQCQRCGVWKHHSRFKFRNRYSPHSTVGEFDSICRDCQQKERNEVKNADRPLAIVQQRARTVAHKADAAFDFVWVQLNYVALVPQLRALMSDEGRCIGCGHPFVNERDIQIEHCEPPRTNQDWARLHTRNLRLTCASCNRTKADKPFAQWLDEQESARLSNLGQRESPSVPDQQLSLFQ